MNSTNKQLRTAIQFSLMAIAIALLPVVGHASTIVLNFDATPLGPGVAVDATAYFNSFGITLSGVTQGAALSIIGQGGPGLSIATSAPNFLNEFHGNNPETFTLNFPTPLSSISFSRTGLTFDSKPQWSAEALNAQGAIVSMVGEPLSATGAPIAAKTFTLMGANITKLQIDSDNHAFTNLSGISIDDLTLVTQASTVPEPSTFLLLSSGLLFAAAFFRRGRKHLAPVGTKS